MYEHTSVTELGSASTRSSSATARAGGRGGLASAVALPTVAPAARSR